MNISIRFRNIFFLLTLVLALWFLFVVHQILTPFVIAMVFAYIFNPLISFFSNKFKIPRTLSILLVYILLITSVIFIVSLLSRSIIGESINIHKNVDNFLRQIRADVKTTPDWLRPYLSDIVEYFSKNQFFSFATTSPFPIFTKAFSGFLTFFAFLFAAFFFLKDYRKMIQKVTHVFPEEYRGDIQVLLKQINQVLSSYLRGQIILVISMIIMLVAAFSFLGVKNMTTIAIISALFEIVPILGPIAAGILGTFVIVITGGIHNFDLNPISTILVIVIVYYVTRLAQDYLIQPFVIGKATKLHPLIILFAVLAGEQIYGVLGVLLAVPLAATIKIVYLFTLQKLHEQDLKRQQKPRVTASK